MAATRLLHPSWHFSFLKEGLLLPARNPGLFGPILALLVAKKVLHASLLVLHPLHETQDVIIVGAVSLLTAVTVDPVIGAITTFAAVTAYCIDNEGETLAFLQVLRRLFNAGGLTVGPVATAVHGQIMAVACQLGVGALLFLADLLVRYTRTLLLHDLLVLVVLVAGLAQLYLGLVLSVAVVVSSSEPECHRSAVLSRAWVTTAKNAPQAVILMIAGNVVLSGSISRRHTTASREPLDLVYLLSSSLTRVFSVCATTAFYNECRHRVQGRAEELLLIETGTEWLNSLPLQCRSKLQEILQGRFSMRHMLATLLARVQCLCIWMLAFVPTHPWLAGIAVVCASRIIAEGPPSIFYRNGLVSYRNLLRQKYHIYPKGCVVYGSRGRFRCP